MKKRILTILLCLCMAISMAACGDKNGEEDITDNTDKATADDSNELIPSDEDDEKRIKKATCVEYLYYDEYTNKTTYVIEYGKLKPTMTTLSLFQTDELIRSESFFLLPQKNEEKGVIEELSIYFDDEYYGSYVFAYDDKGNLLQVARGEYGDDGNWVDWPDSEYWYNKVDYEYDGVGNLSKRVFSHGEEEYSYDSAGNLTSKITAWCDLDGNISYKRWYKYFYDEEGNLIEKTDYNGETEGREVYSYDSARNLLERKYYNSDDVLANKNEYRFDDSGNLIKDTYSLKNVEMLSIVDVDDYEYDEDGNLIKYIYNGYNNERYWHCTYEYTFEYYD